MGQARLTSITESKAAEFDRKASERDTRWCDRLPGLHLIKLKKGSTWRYRYRDATGKRRTATIGKLTEKKPEDAARKVLEWSDNEADPLEEREQKRQNALSAQEQAERRTLRRYLESDYRRHMEAWKPENSRNTEQRIRNHFSEFLERDMATLNKQDIRDWQTRTEELGRAYSTIRRTYGDLKTLLNQAVEDEVLEANPLAGVKLRSPKMTEQQRAEQVEKAKKAERRMLTDDEIRSVLAGLESFAEEIRAERRSSRAHGKSYLTDLDAVHHPHWFIPMTHLALHTGLRPGDLRTLTWEELKIRFGRLRKVTEKSKVAQRRERQPAIVDMKLNSTIQKIMAEWWQDQGRPDTGLVFPSPRTGRELDKHATRKPWKRVKVLGGLPEGMDYYAFRHHFISAQLAAGVPMFTVARMAGHKDVSMIQEHYGHICEQQTDEAVDVVGATITRAAKGAAV
ncbi:tyrosine-type recombinase/integrase [Halospina sp. K52047b]|uniref:tyrosine-type recombinase/integrase n=1 Tax=Halospina sp. K52047b TaxID=2614160 RepID=UPI00124A4FD8|nr:tyrosine-type recombinase/integrase [Halospina sp. K52047b]KAA8984552.1 tyrosine-type recombinase/integrase [Halospina sp. K52047b]